MIEVRCKKGGVTRSCYRDLPHLPTTHLRKIYFDTVVFTPYQLQELVRETTRRCEIRQP